MCQDYPRGHLYVSGGLLALLLLLSMLPGGGSVRMTTIPIEPVEPPSRLPSTPVAVAAREVVEPSAQQERPSAQRERPSVQRAEPYEWVRQRLTVGPGDNLTSLFAAVGLGQQTVSRLLNSGEEAEPLSRPFPGHQLDFLIRKGGELEQLRLLTSPAEGLLFIREGDGFRVETIQRGNSG